jgi:hypothetical protein
MEGTGVHEKRVVEIFDNMLNATDENDLAAAVLTACVVFVAFLEEGDHMLCMGIRHGLFGADAHKDATILEPLSQLFDLCNKQSDLD